MNEFELIERYFASAASVRDDVVLGIGDDAALLRLPCDRLLASAQVTLACADEAPALLAARVLDRTLARLACRGASPRWATLALTLPGVDLSWLDEFASTLARRLALHGIALVGGDTTRGEPGLTLSVHGDCERRPPPPAPAIGHRLWLADVDAATALRLGRTLQDGIAVLCACDSDPRAAARALAETVGLLAEFDAEALSQAGESALLVARPVEPPPAAPGSGELVALGRLRAGEDK